ncbi:hypothetical protein BaRGS_00019727 [Batillaria attramentaria]|uniref:Uncharacterized protein n=1 Tax=Batillaria attramentaria TaxID=370345 RepID=A0ABD0KQ30_9CAEN
MTSSVAAGARRHKESELASTACFSLQLQAQHNTGRKAVPHTEDTVTRTVAVAVIGEGEGGGDAGSLSHTQHQFHCHTAYTILSCSPQLARVFPPSLILSPAFPTHGLMNHAWIRDNLANRENVQHLDPLFLLHRLLCWPLY